MTWEPTHVQLTVLRARNLVGKIKGKNIAKITDVFVTIALGKEKFQTSTVKYGGKVNNSVEWFEECDLSIPHMSAEVEVQVMNRGLLSDEFIGYVSVPLKQYDVYERPRSHWVQLGQKPSKLPDGRCRGELEIRLTFHVRSKTDDSSSTGSLKTKRSGSIKTLVSAMGDKFSRRLSLRGSREFFTPQPHKPFKNVSTKTTPYSGDIIPTNNPVKFEAVDLYVPEQCWRENEFENDLGDGNFARSYSLTSDKRRNNRDFKSRSLMELPGERSFTLPSRGRSKQRPSLDDSALGQSHTSSRSSRSSVTSQDGYLENMFRKECEVDDRMNDIYNDNIEEESEGEYEQTRRRSAQVLDESLETETESEMSESDSDNDQITLPKVKLKTSISAPLEGSVRENNELQKTAAEDTDESREIHSIVSQCHSLDSETGNRYKREGEVFDGTVSPSEYTSELDRVIAREQSRNKSNTLNSQGTSDGHTSSHTSSSSISYQGKSAAERAFDRGSTDSVSASSRKKISPKAEFSFTSQTSNEDTRPQRKKSRQYVKGGRRYTVQGLEGLSTHRSAPDIRDQRPVLNREDSVPGDLMAVYKNMNREELIKLVVTHKAQLIRKDQYIKELENYIDNLLVRVMESSPRILQNL
ncbi:rab11 family-interacting protein 1-like isoform X2 [Mercenaria mercenaria]|uniref:rab11 family-interacting protein 1-like isoform X2 n=1 Tax=Mercenaria mercenaria TaxID=6596 RepID=UPI00234E5AF5|nr:rab11 family-interacting protein 1-like isoform X2 [Mercenaria mercenaria]